MKKRRGTQPKLIVTLVEKPAIAFTPSPLALTALQMHARRAETSNRRPNRSGAKRAAIRQEW